jgi:hypothetical protein
VDKAAWKVLICVLVFVLVGIARSAMFSTPSSTAPPTPTTEHCFPLSPRPAQVVHRPLDSGLPPPSPRRELSFRHAVHTLFLDETVVELAADAGFDTVVQVFPWRDLNPQPGLYSWAAGDHMVRTARAHGLELVVRLDMPPDWATVPDACARGGFPFDPHAYADFVGAVAERYQGHILGYVIWNEPNLAAEWSRSGGDLPRHWESYDGWVARPEDYAKLLCMVQARVRAADPEVLILGGGLAPTNEFSPRAMDDREFLDRMLAAGAGGCFDVLAVHDYGYGLSPEDERGAHGGLNLARVLDLRDVMVNYGVAKPVWITELGYTVHSQLQPTVSEREQADYLTGAFERVRRDWPWVEMLAVWNLCYGRPPEDEMSGYSLVESDLTPRPAYRALKDMGKWQDDGELDTHLPPALQLDLPPHPVDQLSHDE